MSWGVGGLVAGIVMFIIIGIAVVCERRWQEEHANFIISYHELRVILLQLAPKELRVLDFDSTLLSPLPTPLPSSSHSPSLPLLHTMLQLKN